MEHTKIAFGGGCHWCTEAVFQSLKGVQKVKQGYVASDKDNHTFSEAVIVEFNAEKISLHTLIEIHLHTHKSTTMHSMRNKYRSAVYTFTESQRIESEKSIEVFQKEFDNSIITKVLPFKAFKASREAIQNYYLQNPKKPFCENYITPKLKILMDKFSDAVKLNYIEPLT